MNVVFTIIRALVTDLAPPQQLPNANSMIAAATGSGQLFGYLVGALLLSRFVGLQDSWVDPLVSLWKVMFDACREFDE